jgi:oligopeptide/dipeptide ABC transporter ATP-binding protein
MYLGKIIETGTVRQVIRDPRHPYTKGLIDALPKLEDLDAPLTPVPGDIPSPLNRPSGCVFHTRCAIARPGHCDRVPPAPRSTGQGHRVACHYAEGLPVEEPA